MDIRISLNKEIKHINNMTKRLWKEIEISQILWIYFMPMYGWLNKAIKLLMKNHEIRLICSIPRSECSNKYYEFISCLCMVEQRNAFDRKSWNLSKLVLLHSQKWMQQHLIYIFTMVIVILIMDMVIKKISKTHFVTRSDTIIWKRKNGNVKILTKRWKYILLLRW